MRPPPLEIASPVTPRPVSFVRVPTSSAPSSSSFSPTSSPRHRCLAIAAASPSSAAAPSFCHLMKETSSSQAPSSSYTSCPSPWPEPPKSSPLCTMQCYHGRMHPRIGTASTKYTTRKTRTPNAKYYYKPEEFGCIKSPRRPIFSSSPTTL